MNAQTPAPPKPEGIVLTDAYVPKDGSCPNCRAPRSERMPSCGFGRVAKEICGRCGRVFGEVRL